ncbi:MAG: hypothetical protein K0R63_250 [Rickettsiales bacterium]|jgi:chromosomal replication initiation ATPase DnaA|nr:hypothetical protein [Rickettsiales bacterium]
MKPQLSFDFVSDTHTSLHKEDYIASSANEEALHWIEHWPESITPVKNTIATLPTSHALLLYGPRASGKTHLAHIWQERTHAVSVTKEDIYSARAMEFLIDRDFRRFVLDDCHKITDEAALLHFFNQVKEAGKYLLLTSPTPVAQMGIRLPDLRSRLSAIPSVAISSPDEVLFRALLHKHFSDKQLKVDESVIEFLLKRIERSFTAAETTVTALDTQAFEEGKDITIPFIRKALGLE